MPASTKIRGGEVGSIKKLKKSLKRSAGGGQYLKRIPEEGINVRFLTEPDKWVEYFEHYDEDHEPRYYPCTEACEGCEMNLSKSKRYLTNALDLDDGNKVVPLVIPASLASDLIKRYDRFDTLMDRDYELSKEGTGLNTEYSEAYEAPSNRKLDKYDLLDLWDILAAQLGGDDDDDDDDEDEPPRRSVKKAGGKKVTRRADDDDDKPKRVVKKSAAAPKKKTLSPKTKTVTKKAVSKKPVKKTIKRK